MNKIKVVSFYVARLLDFLVIVLPIYIILKWVFIDAIMVLDSPQLTIAYLFSDTANYHDLVNVKEIVWTPWSRLIACCSQLIGYILFWIILYFLAKIFHCYEVGEIFTMKNAQSYYQIGKLLFFDALIVQPISGGLWVLASTLSNPIGQRYISISIGMPNIMTVFMGLLVIFISWVMIEGSKIQDEQQLII